MRLGILADTHDEVVRTRSAVQLLRNEGVSALVHCGDLASSPIVETLACLPSWFTFGNHDADAVSELLQASKEYGPICLDWGSTIELAGKRIAITHGHMTMDVRRVMADHPDYLLTGHTHFSSDILFGPVRRINPGALHRAEIYTVAVLDLLTGELQTLKVE